jgi:hypothetical protein
LTTLAQLGVPTPSNCPSYDATGIVTAAREYRAGRAKVLFTVRCRAPPTRQIEKIYCRNNLNVLVAMIYLFIEEKI